MSGGGEVRFGQKPLVLHSPLELAEEDATQHIHEQLSEASGEEPSSESGDSWARTGSGTKQKKREEKAALPLGPVDTGDPGLKNEALLRIRAAQLKGPPRKESLSKDPSASQRALNGFDRAADELAAGRGEAAADILEKEAKSARGSAAKLQPGWDRSTLELMAENMEARTKMYRAKTSAELRSAVGSAGVAAHNARFAAEAFDKDGKKDQSQLLAAVGGDTLVQAQNFGQAAIKADAALGKAVSKTYRDIADASFAKNIDGSGTINNWLTGSKDKLEADRKKMGAAFDHVDKLIERDGLSFHEAWHQMFDDNKMTKPGEIPGFVTAHDAASFIRDHDTTKGLLAPMADLSEGLKQGDSKKIDAARGNLVSSLRENRQWDIAHEVLSDYEKNAATPSGKQQAAELTGNESKEKWLQRGGDFVRDELPVLVLSGVVSGGVGWGARAGAAALNYGPKAVKAAQVGAEILSFVPTERVLNDAINNRRADWSPGALGRDVAITAAGYGLFTAAGKGWQAFRAKNPKLGGTAAGAATPEIKLPSAGSAALKRTSQLADEVVGGLDSALTGTWGGAGGRSGAHAQKLQKQVTGLRDEIVFARDLLKTNPSEASRLQLEKLLGEAQGVNRAAGEYAALTPPSLPKGRAATPTEIQAHKEALAAFEAKELALRTPLQNQTSNLAEQLYRGQAELAGVRAKSFDPAHSSFKTDPLERARTLRANGKIEAGQNVGFGELELGGKVNNIGPAASGSQAGAIPRSNYYAPESRVLPQKPGQHGFPRANDSEVQVLENARELLKTNPNAPGTLRIYTENPPCPSCLRVMAKFRSEFPNVNIEVFHGRGG